jgi:regulator of protease activity HflC (stomatin/prohibitin superfamily)
MNILISGLVIVVVLALLGLAMSARIVKQYEDGVLFRLGRVVGERAPGFRLIIPFVDAAIDQIAQTTLRKVVGQHTLDQTPSETDKINLDIRAILDVTTVDWGVEVTLVELKDIQLPDSMKRAMARQA